MYSGSFNQSTPSVNNPWLFLPQPRPHAELKLFCFAYAGGNANVFRSWVDKLDARIELHAVQLPGRAARFKEPLLESMEEILDALEKVLTKEFEHCSYAFFGHSMGASIAFELTRRLQAKGVNLPKRLIVSGRRAPSLPLAQRRHIHTLPKAEFIERLKTLNGTADALLAHEDLMSLMEPILRSDFKVIETWQYKKADALRVPLSIFTGIEDEHMGEESQEAWKKESILECETHVFPGGHFYLQSYEDDLLKKINSSLL